jgi:hypothetical protein
MRGASLLQHQPLFIGHTPFSHRGFENIFIPVILYRYWVFVCMKMLVFLVRIQMLKEESSKCGI